LALASSPIRLTHVVGGTRAGSTRVVLDFLRGHDRSRFEPAVCFFSIAAADPAVLDEARAMGVPFRDVVKRSRYDLRSLFELRSALRSLGTEVAVLHGFGSYSFGAPAARLAGVRRVVRYEHAAELYGRHYIFTSRLTARLCDSTVLVSNAVLRYLRANGIEPPRPEVIANGIDARPYLDAPPPFSHGGPPIALMAARLDSAKDHDTLLKAIALMREPVELRLAGTGPFEGRLRALAASLGIAEHVRFLGWRDDLAACLAEADIGVLSTKTEGFGLAAVEAMAAGRPVIATNVDALPEIVTHGRDGLLVEPGSAQALADALTRLVSRPDESRRMGAAGRERVLADFLLARATRRFEAHLLNDTATDGNQMV
jgi:glycosyltransferase involved in cell wall biosynthesis